MLSRIREVRRARGLTLQDVAERCHPATTPQTIGRLETGTRTVSVPWLNRIAAALDVEAADLVSLAPQVDIPVAAILDYDGVCHPKETAVAIPPRAAPGMVAVLVRSGAGDYRSGDEIWLSRLEPEAFASALNRDVLLPRPGVRFIFGRLIGREDGRVQLLALGAGRRQMVLADPPWMAVATTLIRSL